MSADDALSTTGDAHNATDDVGEHRRATMERELNRDWEDVRACLGDGLDPVVLRVARNSFWLGVKSGVQVTAKAINGAFR